MFNHTYFHFAYTQIEVIKELQQKKNFLLIFSLSFFLRLQIYFRNQAEVLHTCRGTISLHGALIHTVDSCTFVISNGGTQTFHIKGNFMKFYYAREKYSFMFDAANNEVERQSWVTALELAKAKAIRAIESEEEEEDNTAHTIPSEELNTAVRDLTIK